MIMSSIALGLDTCPGIHVGLWEHGMMEERRPGFVEKYTFWRVTDKKAIKVRLSVCQGSTINHLGGVVQIFTIFFRILSVRVRDLSFREQSLLMATRQAWQPGALLPPPSKSAP